jgi:DNA-directed RNA polymerase specialized sigma24 family protein
MKRRGPTRESFEALLAYLDPDRERAAERYEIIRRKLVRFFEWWGCEAAEELADETLDRVGQQLAGGLELKAGESYFYGVARYVYREDVRGAAREHRALERGGWPLPETPAEIDDPYLVCLRRCLDESTEEERTLALRYYQGEDKIRNRQALAGEMGIQLNALRIRVHRVRRKLEVCVYKCLGHREDSSPDETFSP